MPTPQLMDGDKHLSIGDKPIRNLEELGDRVGALAVRRSIQRLEDGSATSAEIIYWLQQSSPKARLERKKLQAEVKLTEAKIEALESERSSQTDYGAVLEALKSYRAPIDGGAIEDAEFREIN